MKKFLWLFLVSACAFIIVAKAYQQQQCSAKDILKKIPLEDQIVLDTFLRKVVGQSQIGFALFGSKAVASSGYFTSTPWDSFLFHPYHKIQKCEFYTWKKYKHLFQSENFCWLEGEEDKSIGVIGFALVNKKKFLKTVSENLKVFQNELRSNFSPESLYEKLRLSEKKLIRALNDNVVLEGILLGFGKKSAYTYFRWDTIEMSLKPKPPYKVKKFKPRPKFATLDEERKFLKRNFYCSVKYRDRWCILMMKPVQFMDSDDAEARRLRRKYRYDAEKINKIFEGKSYLEVVLEQIWAKDPICLE